MKSGSKYKNQLYLCSAVSCMYSRSTVGKNMLACFYLFKSISHCVQDAVMELLQNSYMQIAEGERKGDWNSRLIACIQWGRPHREDFQ